MKKLMIALAAVAVAAVTQAAAVSWSTSNSGSPLVDIGGTSVKSSTQFTTYSAIATFFDSTGTAITTSTGTFSSKFGSFTGSWDGAETKTSYYAQLVITDKDGNTLTSEKAAFAMSSSASGSINFATGSGFSTATSKFDQSGSTYGWVAAPEPTSGLLLLLGVAGLALKRKRA